MRFKLQSGAALALALAAGGAQAQMTGQFEVTSFSYAVTGGSLSWLDGSGYQTLAVESAEAGGLGGNDVDGSTDSLLVDRALSTGVLHAGATAWAAAGGTLGGAVGAQPTAGPLGGNPHFAAAMAQQSLEFMLSQAGSVTFTIGYALAASAIDGDAIYSFAQSSLEFAAGSHFNASGGTGVAEVFSFEAADGYAQDSGVFEFTVQLAGPDDIGYYNLRGNAYASAVSAVPEPSQWALMGAGLGLLGFLQRRRACAADGARA